MIQLRSRMVQVEREYDEVKRGLLAYDKEISKIHLKSLEYFRKSQEKLNKKYALWACEPHSFRGEE